MRKRILVVLFCVAGCGIGMPAAAQFKVSNQTAAYSEASACLLFVRTDPSEKMSSSALEDLKRCLAEERASVTSINNALAAALREGKDPSNINIPVGGTPTSVPMKLLNPYLIKEQLNLRLIKRWVNGAQKQDKTANVVLEIGQEYDFVHDQLDDLLRQRSLRELFSAALVAGAVVGNGESTKPDTPGQQGAAANAHVVWESKHFGDDSFSDISFGGKFGFIPALSLVTAAANATNSDKGASESEAVYQEAFAWDIGAHWNIKRDGGHAAELSFVGRLGQTVLGSQSTLIDRGADSILAVPVGRGNQAAMYYEAGVQYSLYNAPLEVVHGEGSMVSPAFKIELLYKNDNRFRNDNGNVAFDAPERRLVFAFMIDALRIVDHRQLADNPRVFTFGFGVEHEAAIGKGSASVTVPAGTKLVFRGDLDLLRAIRGRS